MMATGIYEKPTYFVFGNKKTLPVTGIFCQCGPSTWLNGNALGSTNQSFITTLLVGKLAIVVGSLTRQQDALGTD